MKTKSATQPGVQANAGDTTTDDQLEANLQDGKREPTARELAMEAIAGGNDERIAEEIVANGGTDPRKPAGTTADPDKTGQDDQLEQQIETPKVLDSGLDKTLVKIKIDGVEEEVSVEELKRNYQKGGAADRRLAEATALLKEAKATVVPPVRVETTTTTGDSPSANEAKPSQVGKDFVSALFEGDEEKALAALERIGLGRPEGSTQSVDELAAQLTPAIKQQLIDESALEKFAENFADIVSDPYLADMADRFLEEEKATGKTTAESLETAGLKTRDWLKSKGVVAPTVPDPAAKPTTARDQKLERKAGIDQIPTVHTKATVQEEPIETASDVIAQMRKARGLDG